VNLSALLRPGLLVRGAAVLFASLTATGTVQLYAQNQQGQQYQPGGQRTQRAAGQQSPRAAAGADGSTSNEGLPIPPESSSVTKHDITLGGKTIHYTATAGNILLRDAQQKADGSIFYVAYTEDGADSSHRPVTFCYNGGPGSASLWVHMGSFGPVRVITASPAATPPAPYKYVPNEYSLLDKTDLVFIDAPLTGFSRAVGAGSASTFSGTDNDTRAFEQFIIRYITVNERWNSPKFLFGESYGTTRSGALVDLLGNDGVFFNGVTLLSSILNYNIRVPGYDEESIGYVPSYAAIAYEHNKVKKVGTLPEWVQQARVFAAGPYQQALAKGDNISPAEMDAVAPKMSQLTGLSVQYLKESRLRVSATAFRKELLRDEDRIMGRYDARFEGWDVTDVGENPGYDPSDTGISGVYVGAFHDYLQKELKYTTSEPYILSAGIGQWSFQHRSAGGGRGGGGASGDADVVIDISDAMRKNPKLRIFSANGWFDLATPFFITEYDLAHLGLPPELRKNVEFGYYPAGHMVYLNVEALKQMHADMERFYTEATHD
jgi:carboxypeptidase C (cathepsin A)